MKKSNVKEIVGVLWLLDDNGNLIKKVKKKAKPGGIDTSGHPSNHSGSLLDDNGNLTKKLKKKAKPGDIDTSGHPSNHSSSHDGKKKRSGAKPGDIDTGGNPLNHSSSHDGKKKRSGAKPGDIDTSGNPLNHSSSHDGKKKRLGAKPGDIDTAVTPLNHSSSHNGKKKRSGAKAGDIDTGGNPLSHSSSHDGKKKRSGAKPGDIDTGGNPLNHSSSHNGTKKRSIVKEIDGALYQVDEHGNPIKKVRRKNSPLGADKHRRSSSTGPVPGRRRQREKIDPGDQRLRSNSIDSPKKAGRFIGSQLRALFESPGIVTKESAFKKLNRSNRTLMSLYEPNLLLGQNSDGASGFQIAELSKQITDYGEENRALKTELSAFEEKVRTLTEQNQREKLKNVKSTTEILGLKADYQQERDEKRNLELQIKILEDRYREKEKELQKLESMPANRRMQIPENASGGSDHLVTQINDLMGENDALLDKLELAKASSGHDVKKKEEQILFLTEELTKVREENDMLFLGEAKKDPLMGRLLEQEKDLEAKLEQEREKSTIQIDSMQERIQALEISNATLKKELEKVTLEVNEDDDDDVRRAKEMAQAVANRGTSGNARQIKRATSRRAFGFRGLMDMSNHVGA